jgi:YidC/Oxa1 family membrane protein insertase
LKLTDFAQISTFQSLRLRVPGKGSQLTLASSGAAWRKASLAAGPAAIRFKSSMPEPVSPPVPETTTETTTSPSEFVESATDLSDFDLSTIPERIGYLKGDLGLDYGWGTSALMQWVIEHLHIWGGLPWWAAIIGTGLVIRAALLPASLGASDQAAKMHNLKPVITPLRDAMMRELQQGNQVVGQQKRTEMKEIHKAHGVQTYKTFLPMIQIPLGFGIFRVTRGMTSLPLPGFLDESFFWIKDLTVCDPMYILPVITSAAMYWTFKVCPLLMFASLRTANHDHRKEASPAQWIS